MATPFPLLPHHRLVAYQVAVELLAHIRTAEITDARLRDQALRAAKSACLNLAEGAGRVTSPDKARAFAIARGEVIEAIAALEIAEAAGEAHAGSASQALPLANRLYGLITGLIRR